MSEDHPYKAEYAKSGRASCKGCRSPIDAGTLRLARIVQSAAFDGKIPYWYHFTCFFQKNKPKAYGDIAKVDGLRYEDQQKIKEKLGMSNGSEKAETNGKKGKKASKRGSTSKAEGSKAAAAEFKIEYAASGRAVCIGCEQKIMKDEIRAAKMDYESEKAVRFGGIPRWYHLDCFNQCRIDTEFWDSGASLPGFNLLKPEDQKKVKDALPKMAPVKKEEADEDGAGPSKRIKIDEEAYKKQTKALYKLRDNLETLSKADTITLLEYNKQQVPAGKDRILDLLADVMSFGALDLCSQCKKGNLYYRAGGYHCEGADEWANCGYVTQEPGRKTFKVPKKLKTVEFLANYKGKVGKRIIEELERSTQSASNVPVTMKSTVKVNRPTPPLYNMHFAVQGSLKKTLDSIKKQISKLGGRVVSKVDELTIAVISDKKNLEKSGTKIQDAEEYGVQVIPLEFLDEVEKGGKSATDLITQMAISSWGNDPTERLKKTNEIETQKSEQRSKSKYLKSDSESKVKVQLKNGAYVDPDSGLDKVAHVYKQGNDLYTAVLSKADVQQGSNSYYKLQLLEADKKRKYWVFRSWGRIGTTIGKTKLEDFEDVEDAIDSFCEVFEEKSGNPWDHRKKFKKVAGKYFLMDIDMGTEQQQKLVQLDNSGLKSSLPPPVQDLVKTIFDVKAMEQTMLEFELDLQKMPLGKLSQNQIKSAFTELSKLQDLITSEKKTNPAQIISFTNRFYTLIPHSAGLDALPMLDNEEIIKSKLEMLESLMEMEVAYSMMKVEEGVEDKKHPIDLQYAKLKTTIRVLERDSPEFGHLLAYVKNTHAETHSNYELDIEEVFKVERHGEDKRYKPFKNLPNRKLLWHGSRTTNYAGILSQGLRIAPPEAPVTGYMFGKGIYFADMVSKSANYCYTSKTNNTGLLLLCEVALGETIEHTQATFVEKLPKGKHSVKGVGRTHPDPSEAVVLPHGVEIPLGKPKPAEINNTSLLYNEYIVYDQSQVKIEYLLKLRFNYKY